jgi:sugar (pentulose or hexulose) kinase
MRAHLFSALATLKLGMDILFEHENVKVDRVLGHGGFFKTKEVGSKTMAAAINVPVSVMDTAGEGGAWGIALLAAYQGKHKKDQTLANFLTSEVFKGATIYTEEPVATEVAGFNHFMVHYKNGLPIEKTAVEVLL